MSETQNHAKNRETITCDSCGIEMWDEPKCREEMALHVGECDGVDDPRERFAVGDRVQYSDLGRERLDREHTEGEVTGFSEEDHIVRVTWDHRKTPQRLAHIFVKHAEGGGAGD